MAGTPTPNYNIPTYADTDAPDLSGAYNDAMGIIDTQLKSNADATAAKQDKLTAGTGIEIQGNEISATSTGGTGYTAGAGIEISGTTINAGIAGNIWSEDGIQVGESYRGPAYQVTTGPAVDPVAADALASTGTSEKSKNAFPTAAALKAYVESKMAATPDATTSVRGLVRLSSGNSVTSSTAVLTETAMINELKTIRNNMATQAVDVQTLAGKLFIDTQTGLVFYKPSA